MTIDRLPTCEPARAGSRPAGRQVAGRLLSLLLIVATFVRLSSSSATTPIAGSRHIESDSLGSRNLTKELDQTTTTTTLATSSSNTPRHCPACGLNDLNCDNVHQCSGPCGQIKSANYPQNYTNNHRCRWSIRAPNGHYVNLSIIDFDIPSANNATKLGTCIFDYLTLIDGYTGKRIGCYCNENLPPAYIVSPWNELIIQFDTNSETTGRGFNVQYEIMKLRLNERIGKQLSNQSDEACLIGWKFFRGFCYRAYNDPEPLQWNDAEKRCAHYSKGLDGHLVSILDRDEMLVILYWLTNEWNSTRYREYYIGLIDETREGLYRWSDNNPMSYTDWELKPMLLEDETPAQPDGGAYEDCTVIRFSSFSRTSNWHDVPCSLGKHYHSHLDKGLQIKFKWDYVSSYICKSDSMSFNPTSQKAKARQQLYSEEFRPSATLLANSVISSTITKPAAAAANGGGLPQDASGSNPSWLQPANQNKTNVIAGAAGEQQAISQRELFLKLSKLDDNRYFVCDNLEVISIVLRCDGVTQCRDGSDESAGCDQDCLEWQFKCANGRCISIGHYCDFSDDCGDGSDESRCERHRCKLNEFRCQNGQCIPAQQRCDLLPDCNDSSDEGRSCTIGSNCNTNTTFQCYNGLCIPQYAVCDFQIDCPGKFHEDEVGCELLQRNGLGIGGGGGGGSGSGSNRSATQIIGDQTGLKHEARHAHEDSGKSWWQQQEAPTPADLFRCKSGNLINASHRCLFEFDRYGFQLGCRDVSHLIDCQDFECPQRDYVKCPNSYCIPWRYVCDGKWDCVLGDDETGCARYLCPGQYKCANQSSCILLHQLCDGARQCPMGDDEWFCDLHCPASCDCIGQMVSCQWANLSGLTRDHMPKSVRKLDLSHNKLGPSLASTNFDAYHDLGELILSHNQIEVLTPRKFHQLRNLYKLDLSYNQIHSVKRGAFAGLRRVTQLLLESNQQLFLLEPEAFLGLSSLQMLNISSSRISSLRKNTFDGLTSLRHLLLRSNMILSIEDGAFRSLTSLVSLDMRGNDIKHFTKLVFTDLKSLRNLSTDSFKFCCLVNHQIPADKCLPLPDEISDCEDLLSSVPQRTCIWIAGGFACVGNLIVIIWRYRDRLGQKEREVEHVNSTLLLSLGFSDLLMGIYLIIIALVDSWYRGRYIENADKWRESPLCNLCGFLSTISSTVSVLTLVFIAYNRYLEICRPFKVADKFTLGYTQRLIRFSWLMALTIATLPLVIKPYFRGQFYAKSGVCLAYHITDQKAAGWLYSILVSPCVNLISFIIIFRCYISIYVEISRATRRNEQMDRAGNGGNHQIKIILIILTHFVAFSPPMIIGFMSLAGYTPPAALYSWIAVSVLPVNSAINPMIYTIPNIRHTINMLIINYRARKTATWIRAQSSTGNGSPSTGRSAGVAIPLTSQQAQQQQQQLPQQQLERPLPLPMLKPDARMRKLLARRNVPPGYLAIRHFIQARDYLRPDHLIEIALALAQDIESKHRDSKIYASLKLDDVFVSDLVLVERPAGQNAPPEGHRDRLAVFLADHDGYRPRRSQPCCQLSREPLRSNSLGLYSSQRPGALKSSNHQQAAGYHNNSSNHHHHHHHHYKHNHRAMLNCECHDVDRFGDILRKLLQLYQNRKVAAGRPVEPIANDDTTS